MVDDIILPTETVPEIVHKYDGLRIFVKSNRLSYIWNSDEEKWDPESTGSTSGSGTINKISKWVTTDSLGDSSLFNIFDRIGLNVTDPKSLLQINSTTSGVSPLNLGVRQVSPGNDSATIAYNYYFESTNQRFDNTKLSSFIEMTSGSSFRFRSRLVSSSDWNSLLDLNHDGWNFLRSAQNGTFIQGNVYIGTGTPSILSQQFLTVGGSIRTQSSVFNNVKLVNQTTSSYTILDSDHKIIFSRNSGNFTVNLPTLNINNLGRELVLILQSSSEATFMLSSAPLGLNNSDFSSQIGAGTTVTLVSFNFNGTPRWKIVELKGSGTLNQVAYWSNDNRLIGNNNFVFNGNDVGIGGVPTPSDRLHVNGNIRLQTSAGSDVGIFLRDNSTKRLVIGTNTNDTNSLSWIELQGNGFGSTGRLNLGGSSFRVFTDSTSSSTGSERFTIESNGNYNINSNLLRVDSDLTNNTNGLYREHTSSISVSSTTINQFVFQSGKMTITGDTKFISIFIYWQRVGRVVSGNVRLIKNPTTEALTNHNISLPIINTTNQVNDGSCFMGLINNVEIISNNFRITSGLNLSGGVTFNMSFSYRL